MSDLYTPEEMDMGVNHGDNDEPKETVIYVQNGEDDFDMELVVNS